MLLLVLCFLIAVSAQNWTETREEARAMFYFGFDNYMQFAFPLDELDPVNCKGRTADPDLNNINVNDALGNFSLTLIDTLDTLFVMGDVERFKESVRLVIKHVNFDQDHVIQLFEVNIRVLGGLISAHLIAQELADNGSFDYEGELLSMAKELGSRLLPAFENTPTHMPHPRVNLRSGVPKNWRVDSCPAGISTITLEFGMLSRLTADPTFEGVARRGLRSLWEKRDNVTDLLGCSIDVMTGNWLYPMSTLGAGIDSFYEYLFKAYVLFGDREYLYLFEISLSAVNKYMKSSFLGVYQNIHMKLRGPLNYWIDSLQAYFPSLFVISGDIKEAIEMHALFQKIWERFSALPERFNYMSKTAEIGVYPLRPELAESTYHLYRATRDPLLLHFGKRMIKDINTFMRTRCGFATLHDVHTKTLEDRTESFFFSETTKYLYLLFDEHNILHNNNNNNNNNYVFSTQGHIFHLPYEKRRMDSEYYVPLLKNTENLRNLGLWRRKCYALPWQFYFRNKRALNSTIHSFVYGAPPQPGMFQQVIQVLKNAVIPLSFTKSP